MGRFVDLSHELADAMPGFRLKQADGSIVEYSARIRPFLTHEQTSPAYQHKASFEITEVSFQTSVSTYLDAPYHRYPEGRDIASIGLDEVIVPGTVVDVSGRRAWAEVPISAIPDGLDVAGKAVLFRFGYARHFGTEPYYSYPFLSEEVVDWLVGAKPALVGVDTINIDDSRNPVRPAHTKLLARDIFVVENLANLDELPSRGFRFFAVPLKARRAAAMPIRAFAEIDD